MAQLIRFPSPEDHTDWKSFALSLTRVLQDQLGNLEQPSPAGLILFNGAVPDGYLPANGASFDPNTYPALAHFLGGTSLPLLTAPVGFTYGIKAK